MNAYALRMLVSLRSSDRPGLWLSAHSSSAPTGHTMDLTRVMAKGTYGLRRLMGQSVYDSVATVDVQIWEDNARLQITLVQNRLLSREHIAGLDGAPKEERPPYT